MQHLAVTNRQTDVLASLPGTSVRQALDMPDLFALGAVAGALAAASGSGLLDALLQRQASPEEFATQLRLDPRATIAVLQVLESHGVVEERTGEYLASRALCYLEESEAFGLNGLISLWSHTPAFLASGIPLVHMDGSSADRGHAYADAVRGLARTFGEAAEWLAEHLPRCSAHILDVGAGSAVWSIAMAQVSPSASVTALDLPEVVPVAQELARSRGIDQRFFTLTGNYHDIRWPTENIDRVVLANVIHLEEPTAAEALVGKAVACGRDGSEVVVIDVFADDTNVGRQIWAAYALHLALRTRHGRTYSEKTVREWMERAGLSSLRRIDIAAKPGGMAAIMGIKTLA
jgi:ubiquinone/menaquinone biosynthesis C-methylase UbiE